MQLLYKICRHIWSFNLYWCIHFSFLNCFKIKIYVRSNEQLEFFAECAVPRDLWYMNRVLLCEFYLDVKCKYWLQERSFNDAKFQCHFRFLQNFDNYPIYYHTLTYYRNSVTFRKTVNEHCITNAREFRHIFKPRTVSLPCIGLTKLCWRNAVLLPPLPDWRYTCIIDFGIEVHIVTLSARGKHNEKNKRKKKFVMKT